MENYVKAIMYAYPRMEALEKEYAEHIENKALLSFKGRERTESLLEYLAGQILQKEKLSALKEIVDKVWAQLSDVEKTLVAIRYFGKQTKIKRFPFKDEKAFENAEAMKFRLKGALSSERNYFRRQARLVKRLAILFRFYGLTEEVFLKEYAEIETVKRIFELVNEGKDKRLTASERRWLTSDT